MRRALLFFADIFWLVLSALPAPLEACTTFCLQSGGQILFGKNYDFARQHPESVFSGRERASR